MADSEQNSEHEWFAEHAAAYVIGRLPVEERDRVDRHAAECPACAAVLRGLMETDERMNTLFAPALPTFGFDERIIRRLKPRVNPLVRQAAVAAAAVILLGGVGFVGSSFLENGRLPVSAFSGVTNIGKSEKAMQLAVTSQAVPSSPAPNKFDYMGGQLTRNTSRAWEKFAASPDGIENARLPLDETKTIESNRQQSGQNVLTANGETTLDQGQLTLSRSNTSTGLMISGTGSSGGGGKFGGGALGNGGTRRELAAVTGGDVVLTQTTPQSSSVEHYIPFAVDAQKARAQAASAMPAVVADAAVMAPSGDEANKQLQTENSQPAPTPLPSTQASARKVIRNGEMEFEVDSFDSAFVQISKIVSEERGFVATTNSTKLPNGKVSGTIEVRVPPDNLDVLVLKLRALGDLKGQKISANDITKEYTDLNSELRADRAMEERLLDLIKDGKGQIKDLLAAEKELGEWRKKIETITGQLNYYDNLVALSTLTLSLTEKNILTPALASQTETVDMGIVSDDVSKARDAALQAIDAAKGRVIDSELKQFDAGQLSGKVVADVPADAAGGVVDRLRQLGTVSRLDIQRQEITTDGQGNPVQPQTTRPEATRPGLRTERKDTRLTVTLYNLANVAPRQTSNVQLVCDDVETTYHAILDRIAKAGGRVVNSTLSRPRPDDISGSIIFEVKSAESDGVLADLRAAGDVMQLNVIENPDTSNVTASKRGFSVQLHTFASVTPREVRTISLATADVTTAYDKLLTSLAGVKAHIVLSRIDREDNDPARTAGFVDFEIRRSDVDAVEADLAQVGDNIQRQIMRSTDNQETLDTKLQFKIALHDATLVPPRESWTLAIESGDVDRVQATLSASAIAAGGKVIDSTLAKEAAGRTTAHLVIEVPLKQSLKMIDDVKSSGDVRAIQSTQNPLSPDGPLARSRMDITLGSPDTIVGNDHGVLATIRSGLTTSVAGLLWSLQLVVIGVCFVLPWAALMTVGWKFIRRRAKARAAGSV